MDNPYKSKNIDKEDYKCDCQHTLDFNILFALFITFVLGIILGIALQILSK